MVIFNLNLIPHLSSLFSLTLTLMPLVANLTNIHKEAKIPTSKMAYGYSSEDTL